MILTCRPFHSLDVLTGLSYHPWYLGGSAFVGIHLEGREHRDLISFPLRIVLKYVVKHVGFPPPEVPAIGINICPEQGGSPRFGIS